MKFLLWILAYILFATSSIFKSQGNPQSERLSKTGGSLTQFQNTKDSTSQSNFNRILSQLNDAEDIVFNLNEKKDKGKNFERGKSAQISKTNEYNINDRKLFEGSKAKENKILTLDQTKPNQQKTRFQSSKPKSTLQTKQKDPFFDKQQEERKLSVTLDDLNKAKWTMRQTKKKAMEQKMIDEIQNIEIAQNLKNKKNNQNSVVQNSKTRKLTQKTTENSQKEIKKVEIQNSEKGKPKKDKIMNELMKLKISMSKEVEEMNSMKDILLSSLENKLNQMKINVSNPFKTETVNSENHPETQNEDLPNNSIKPKLAHVPPMIILDTENINLASQGFQSPKTPPRILHFKKSNFCLNKFDIISNIKQFEINLEKLESCSSEISSTVTTLDSFRTSYTECYSEYVVTVKFLTQIELWNKKLMEKYIMTKKNVKVFRKYTASSHTSLSHLKFSDFCSCLQSHFDRFDFRAYRKSFEKQIKIETQFYEQHSQRISAVYARLNSIQGIYNVKNVVEEWQHEVAAFKSLNGILGEKYAHSKEKRIQGTRDDVLAKNHKLDSHAMRQDIENKLNAKMAKRMIEFENDHNGPFFASPVSSQESISEFEKSRIADEAIALASKFQQGSKTNEVGNRFNAKMDELINQNQLMFTQNDNSNPLRINKPANQVVKKPFVVTRSPQTFPSPSFQNKNPLTESERAQNTIQDMPDLLTRDQSSDKKIKELENETDKFSQNSEVLEDINSQIKNIITILNDNNGTRNAPAGDCCDDEKTIAIKNDLADTLLVTDAIVQVETGKKYNGCDEDEDDKTENEKRPDPIIEVPEIKTSQPEPKIEVVTKLPAEGNEKDAFDLSMFDDEPKTEKTNKLENLQTTLDTLHDQLKETKANSNANSIPIELTKPTEKLKKAEPVHDSIIDNQIDSNHDKVLDETIKTIQNFELKNEQEKAADLNKESILGKFNPAIANKIIKKKERKLIIKTPLSSVVKKHNPKQSIKKAKQQIPQIRKLKLQPIQISSKGKKPMKNNAKLTNQKLASKVSVKDPFSKTSERRLFDLMRIQKEQGKIRKMSFNQSSVNSRSKINKTNQPKTKKQAVQRLASIKRLTKKPIINFKNSKRRVLTMYGKKKLLNRFGRNFNRF